jgi:hypothetical protein
MLIGERNRNFELYVDGNLYEAEEAAVNLTIMRVKALTRKRSLKGRCFNWVVREKNWKFGT